MNLQIMKKIFILLYVTSFYTLISQDADLSTPRNTVQTHLLFLQKDTYKPEVSAKVFKDIEEERAIDLAKKLKKYYDAMGLLIDLSKIPNDSNYYDSTEQLYKYNLFPTNNSINLVKNGDLWYYSNETIAIIPFLYQSVNSLTMDSILSSMPAFVFNKVMGIEIWKLLGLLIYFIIAILLYFIFKKLFGYYLIKFLNLIVKKKKVDGYLEPVKVPVSLFIIFLLFKTYYPYLQLPFGFATFINDILLFILPIFLVYIVFKIIDLFSVVLKILTSKTKSKVDDQLVPILRKAAKVVAFVIGVIYLVDNLGWDYTPLLAGASVGGLALALAAQDTVKNLFGSVTIFTDQPFDVGDWIVFDGNEGNVEEVGVRSTRVRTFYNSVVSIPNGKISDMIVDNMGRRQYRRFKTNIGITYDTPPDLIELYVKGLNDIVMMEKNTRKTGFDIYLNNFDASSLNILVYIFFDVENWSEELLARQSFMLQSISLAEELGIRFAFPTNTLHIEEFPEKQTLTPSYNENKDFYQNKLNNFINSKKK